MVDRKKSTVRFPGLTVNTIGNNQVLSEPSGINNFDGIHPSYIQLSAVANSGNGKFATSSDSQSRSILTSVSSVAKILTEQFEFSSIVYKISGSYNS